MDISTAWVQPPTSISGLDHLGTQAPCVLIYSQLLPGITNVTDRARYYSFYPWLLWSYDQRYSKDKDKFVDYFRRADCLFTLVAEQHSRQTDHNQERHGTAMVGKNQLIQALDRLNSGLPLILSEYSSVDSGSSRRYFQNTLGGLGQYYVGTLTNLMLLSTTTKPWIKYTREYGEPLAKCLASGIDEDAFWNLVERDYVTLEDLNSLNSVCPCNLVNNSPECQTLIDLYFDTSGMYEVEGLQRQKSLGLILCLVQELNKLNLDINEVIFRSAIYTKTLPSGVVWDVPCNFEDTLICWSFYERNDLLSTTFQTIFALLLRTLQEEANNYQQFESIEEFSKFFIKSNTVKSMLVVLNATSLDELIKNVVLVGPSLSNLSDPNHELSVSKKMLDDWYKNDKTIDVLASTIKVIALLAARDNVEQSAYSSLAITQNDLIDYPINLSSFRGRVSYWRNLPIEEFIIDLTNWCLNTHFRVALRKLRQTGRSSFHLRPSEHGLELVGDIPPPAHTTPRFKQAIQIMRDIGVLQRKSDTGLTTLSRNGVELLEKISA